MTSWTKEKAVDKDVKQIKATQTKHNCQRVEVVGGSNIAEFARNPIDSLNGSLHCKVQSQLMTKLWRDQDPRI